MWFAKLGKGMLYSVEQRDERRALLKTPAWEANAPDDWPNSYVCVTAGAVTYQNSLKVACERQTFLFAHRCWGTFREEERLRLSNRNSILMTQNLCGIRSEALYIGRRSSFVVLAIVYEWQTKDKRPQRSNVNTMNLLNKTANICGIKSSLEEAFEFCWSSFADAHNTLPKSTRRNVKLNKFAFGTPWLPDLLCKHWFTSSV